MRPPLRVWLGFGVSALFLFLAARTLDWHRTAAALREVDLVLLGAGALALLATLATFALRWRVLLAGTAALPLRDSFSYLMIGYLANTVLPLRVGDVARAALLGRRHGIEAPRVLGTISLERVLDLLVLLALTLALTPAIDVPPLVRGSVALFAVGTLTALALLVALANAGPRLPALIGRLPTPLAPLGRLAGPVAQLGAGLSTLRNARQLAGALALSGLAWGLAGAGTFLWVSAFHLPVPWYAGLFVLAVINLGGAIPSSPGAVGVYHYLAVLALSVWVTDSSAAMAYAIGTHTLNVLLNVLIGAACLAREGLALGSVTVAAPYRPAEPSSEASPA